MGGGWVGCLFSWLVNFVIHFDTVGWLVGLMNGD
jgi:hypothetical protein